MRLSWVRRRRGVAELRADAFDGSEQARSLLGQRYAQLEPIEGGIDPATVDVVIDELPHLLECRVAGGGDGDDDLAPIGFTASTLDEAEPLHSPQHDADRGARDGEAGPEIRLIDDAVAEEGSAMADEQIDAPSSETPLPNAPIGLRGVGEVSALRGEEDAVHAPALAPSVPTPSL